MIDTSTRQPIRRAASHPFLVLLVMALGCGADKGRTAPATETDTTPAHPPTDTWVGSTPDTTQPGTDTGGPRSEVLTVDVADNPFMALEKRFSITLSRPDGVVLTCVDPTDPRERHVLRDATVSTTHELRLYGILPDTHYDCGVAPAGAPAATHDVGIDVGSLPPEWPTLEVTTAPGATWGHYTLFNHSLYQQVPNRAKLIIVDPEGRTRWFHPLRTEVQNGVAATFTEDGNVLFGGGPGDGSGRDLHPTLVSLSGEPVLTLPDPVVPGDWHHEARLLRDGDIMGLATEVNTDGDRSWMGLRLERRARATGDLLWAWRSQLAFEAGQLVGRRTHANAVTDGEDADGYGIYVSLKAIDTILRIDPSTKEITWTLGHEGDFTLVDASGAPADPSEWFFGQHDPELDGDRVLVYDNGTTDLRRPRTSRAMELALDRPTMTARVTWSYTEPGWYEPYWGDADRLPNDNVLIAIGHCSVCAGSGTTPTSILEVDRATDTVVWRLVLPGYEDVIYRAARYDGCDMFANTRYCAAQ